MARAWRFPDPVFFNASAVKFGTNNAVSYAVNSDNQILATSPTGSGTVDVVVTAPGGTSPTSSADHFAYSLPPVVIGISPSSGPVIGGTIVTINGANFTGVTAVHFGAVAASFTFVNDGSMTATAPAGEWHHRYHRHDTGWDQRDRRRRRLHLCHRAVRNFGVAIERSGVGRHGGHDHRHKFQWR